MHPIINIAIAAARSASKTIIRSLDKLDSIKISQKKHNDFVTEVDKQSEQEIIQTILKAYPDHAILAEESGVTGNSDYVWIIDPLDGTNNFMHGHPHFSISIAVKYKNKLEHGLIYDPLRDELFHATRGGGAYLNNRRIRVSTRKTFDGTTISTGYSNREAGKNLHQHLAVLTEILPKIAAIRQSGSAALDCAYVACGRTDGFWEFNLAPWDIAAGSLIIKEAGGLVSDINGEETHLETGNIIAGNTKLFKSILQSVKTAISII